MNAIEYELECELSKHKHLDDETKDRLRSMFQKLRGHQPELKGEDDELL